MPLLRKDKLEIFSRPQRSASGHSLVFLPEFDELFAKLCANAYSSGSAPSRCVSLRRIAHPDSKSQDGK